eukprot:3821555-Pyramimonas_sp.AAC.1
MGGLALQGSSHALVGAQLHLPEWRDSPGLAYEVGLGGVPGARRPRGRRAPRALPPAGHGA